MSYRHICGSCRNKKCPDAGGKKYDGMLGPTIGCQEYKPSLWSLDGAIDWVLLLALAAIVLCIIHAVKA